MQISTLERLAKETGLSAEQIGERCEMSGMTIRRLLASRRGTLIHPKHHQNILNGVYRLVAERTLSSDSAAVREVFAAVRPAAFDAAIAELGVGDVGEKTGNHEEQIHFALSEIGRSGKHQSAVGKELKRYSRFSLLGPEWKSRISTLLNAVNSRSLPLLEKFVAFGALFYLLEPFDFVPDTIPVFGLVDDFGILGYAALYYSKRLMKGSGAKTRRRS